MKRQADFPLFYCLYIRFLLITDRLLQTLDLVRLLHRHTAPPDEGHAFLRNRQTHNGAQEVYDQAVLEYSFQPALFFRDLPLKTSEIFKFASTEDAELSGKL